MAEVIHYLVCLLLFQMQNPKAIGKKLIGRVKISFIAEVKRKNPERYTTPMAMRIIPNSLDFINLPLN